MVEIKGNIKYNKLVHSLAHSNCSVNINSSHFPSPFTFQFFKSFTFSCYFIFINHLFFMQHLTYPKAYMYHRLVTKHNNIMNTCEFLTILRTTLPISPPIFVLEVSVCTIIPSCKVLYFTCGNSSHSSMSRLHTAYSLMFFLIARLHITSLFSEPLPWFFYNIIFCFEK